MKKYVAIAALLFALYSQVVAQKADRLIQFSGYALTSDSLMGIPLPTSPYLTVAV